MENQIVMFYYQNSFIRIKYLHQILHTAEWEQKRLFTIFHYGLHS